MGVHIDGYITVSAHTVIVGSTATAENPTTGPLANVFHAAWACAEVAARLITPGAQNSVVTEAMKKVCDAYGVKPLSGSVMHQVKRYVIDGNKNIAMHDPTPDSGKTEKCTFEQGEVYALDICLSTGEGKRKEKNTRTTVYRREVNNKYGLKIAASRKFFNEVNAKFPSMPFSLRALDDETSAKMGVRECATHHLVSPYDVVYSEAGAQMAHVKFTVLLCPSGNIKVTGLAMPENLVADAELPDDLKELIASVSVEKKKKNRGNKNKKK
jgi:curved DNA binding protein